MNRNKSKSIILKFNGKILGIMHWDQEQARLKRKVMIRKYIFYFEPVTNIFSCACRVLEFLEFFERIKFYQCVSVKKNRYAWYNDPLVF